MAKNVLPKYWNGSEFEELHIVTKASNVLLKIINHATKWMILHIGSTTEEGRHRLGTGMTIEFLMVRNGLSETGGGGSSI